MAIEKNADLTSALLEFDSCRLKNTSENKRNIL